jgi:DNA polymerase III delta subunit
MTAEKLMALLEEMIDLKLQAYAANNLKLSPEVARLMADKHETDRRRLEQIRTQLITFLDN